MGRDEVALVRQAAETTQRNHHAGSPHGSERHPHAGSERPVRGSVTLGRLPSRPVAIWHLEWAGSLFIRWRAFPCAPIAGRANQLSDKTAYEARFNRPDF